MKVNKETGATETEIEFGKDKEPVYDVDDISGKVYYRAKPNQISCFKI